MSTPDPAPESNKPKLLWYEQAWVLLPLLLAVVGGAVGGACGGAAFLINRAVFQKTQHPVLRYVFTGLISMAAVLTYVIIVVVLVLLFNPPE